MTALTQLPSLKIEINRSLLPKAYSAALGNLRVQQRLSCPAQCELTFLAEPAAADSLGQDPLFAIDNTLGVHIGESPRRLFQGQITAIDYLYQPNGARKIRVRAYDSLQKLRQSFSVKAYVQVTTADLARELVAGYGLSVQAPDAGPLWPRLIQYQGSDLDFLVATAARSGLYVSWQDDALWLFPLAGRPAEEAVPLRLGESLLEASFAVNSQSAGPAVSVSGWDPLRAEPHVGESLRSQIGRETGYQEETLQGLQARTLSNPVVTNDRQAEVIAQASLNYQSAQAMTVWGVADGDMQLAPGKSIDISGVAPTVQGRYVLTAVNHSISVEKGFVSEFSTVPPPPIFPAASPSVAAGYSTALGNVTQLKDPENLGRVQVSLPTCNEVETEWLQVLTPGAGKNKGLVSLPDVGDRVLVLFPADNPAQGIVLGGLYGADADLDWGVEGGRTRRQYWRSEKGQQILYDDDRQLLRLENSHGSYVELLPDKVSIHAAANLTIEAPGQAIKICGKSIDFEQRD